MKSIKIISLFVNVLFLVMELQAQRPASNNTLTLSSAIDLAMKNNQQIQIQDALVGISERQVFKANAGLLPTVNALGGVNYANNYTEVDIRTFQENNPLIEVNDWGVASTTLNLGVQADYALYDGRRGKQRLQLFENQAIMARQQSDVLKNNTTDAVIQLFFEIQKIQNQETLLEENISISEERVQKMKDRLAFGKVNQLAVLRAQTDLNQDINTLDNIRLVKTNLIQDLNFLLGKNPNEFYRVDIDLEERATVEEATLQNDIANLNPEVQLSQKGIALAMQQLELAKADQMPVVGAFANFGLFWQKNDLQQLARLQNIGFTVGISARYNLFDGGIIKNQIQTKQLQVEVEKMRNEQLVSQLHSRAVKEKSNIELLQVQIAREQQNLETFEENFNRTQERFYVGKATALDLRAAQLAQLNAKITIDDLKIKKMQAMYVLEKYRGRLLQD
ncbi:MAG: TolC family protein [Bacteroidota bacterium]